MISFSVSICLVWLIQNVLDFRFFRTAKIFQKIQTQFLALMIIVFSLSPFLAGQRIATTFFSGNWNGFFAPYPIPDDLLQIKTYLDTIKTENRGKLVVFPSSEVPLRVTNINSTESIKTIDKTWIYYLDYPSIYYGLGSKNKFKDNFFLVYFNLINNRTWLNLIRNKGAEYILVNKKLAIRDGFSYRNDIEERIQNDIDKLEKIGLVTKILGQDDWLLYQLREDLVKEKPPIYLNQDWSRVSKEVFNKQLTFPEFSINNINREICLDAQFAFYGGQDDRQKNLKDLNLMCQKREIGFNDNLLPFKQEIASTDDFISNSFSILTTNDSPQISAYNNLDSINPGTYNSIDKKSIFLTDKGAVLNFNFSFNQDGKYNLDIRAKVLNNQLKIVLRDKQNKVLQEKTIFVRDVNNFVNTRGDFVLNNFNYFTLIEDFDFVKGDYTLEIEKLDNNTMAFDAITYYNQQTLDQIENEYFIDQVQNDVWLYTKK